MNKHLEEDIEVEFEFHGDQIPCGEAEVYSIYHDDVWAANTKAVPDNVLTRKESNIPAGRKFTFLAKKHSINLLKMNKV